MSERIHETIRLFTEMPGYEEIFEHFQKEYAARVMSCSEENILDERRRYDWLESFKTEIDNFNCDDGESYE